MTARLFRRIVLAGILGIMSLPLLVFYVVPLSWLLPAKEKKSPLCEEFCQVLDAELLSLRLEDRGRIGESRTIILENSLEADTCIVTKTYSSRSYSELRELGIPKKVAKRLCYPHMTEGCDFFLLRDDKIVCEAHTYHAYAAAKVLVSDIGPQIRLRVELAPANILMDPNKTEIDPNMTEIDPKDGILLITDIE